MEPSDLMKAQTEAFLEHPVFKQLLEAGAAIEPLNPETFHMEEAPAPLPVDVQSRETPTGVPLHEILSALQREVPGLRALHVRDRTLMLTYAAPPTDEDRGKIARVLSDPARLTTPRPASLVAAAAEPDPATLLRDPEISDQDWLRAFRQYALKFLIQDGA
jgi:hypothetical protein